MAEPETEVKVDTEAKIETEDEMQTNTEMESEVKNETNNTKTESNTKVDTEVNMESNTKKDTEVNIKMYLHSWLGECIAGWAESCECRVVTLQGGTRRARASTARGPPGPSTGRGSCASLRSVVTTTWRWATLPARRTPWPTPPGTSAPSWCGLAR